MGTRTWAWRSIDRLTTARQPISAGPDEPAGQKPWRPGRALAPVAVIASAVLVAASCMSPSPSASEGRSTTAPASSPGASAASPAAPGQAASSPRLDHVVVIVMENQGYGSIVGNPAAPWINAAIARYGSATDYWAVAHPSQPNYIALTAGSTFGVTGDSTVTVNAPSLIDQLEARGLSWKAYMQALPAGGDRQKLVTASARDLYVRKHDPFASYVDIQAQPGRLARIVDFGTLAADLTSGALPAFAWISPDQCHDMHGIGAGTTTPCTSPQTGSGLVASGDQFLATWVPRILASPAWTSRSAIFITWDEAEGDSGACCGLTSGGGHVLTLVIAAGGHRSSNVAYTHYSLLATIEDELGLGCLDEACDREIARLMTDLVPQGS